MPIAPTYPGVYVEEIPSGVRTITGVATSIAAFIGFFNRGILNKPVQIFSIGDLEREFGGLNARSEACYAIQQFFMNGGTEAWVVRAASGSVQAADVNILSGINGATALAVAAGRSGDANPGEWGNNLRVSIDYPTPASGSQFNMTVSLVETRNSQQVVVDSEVFRGLSMDSNDSKFVDTVVNDEFSGSKYVNVTASGSTRPLQTGTVSGSLATFPTITSSQPQLNVTIGTDGAGTATLSSVPTSLSETRQLLESAIRAARPELKAFAQATVSIVDDCLRILAGPTESSSTVTFAASGTDSTMADLGLSPGTSLAGVLSGDLSGSGSPLSTGSALEVTIGGSGPITLTLTSLADITAVSTDLEAQIRAASTDVAVAAADADAFANARVMPYTDAGAGEERIIVLAGLAGASVSFSQSGADTLVNDLALNGGATPIATAFMSDDLTAVPTINSGSAVDVTIGSIGPETATITVASPVSTMSDIADALQAAIRSAHSSTAFTDCRVAYRDSGENRLIILPGVAGDVISFTAAPLDGTTVTQLRLDSTNGATPNVQTYALGAGAAIQDTAQGAGTAGNDGSPPDSQALIGDLNSKTGIYALEDVDLFNILCIPRTAMITGDDALNASASQARTQAAAVITAAINYCEQRRAFFIMDTPNDVDEVQEIKDWLDSYSTLRHKNAALYFPRVHIPDPLNEYRLRSVGASGTMAGVYARTDSSRGVWKAPGGTEATLRNVQKFDYTLTDSENGTLNPLAINCLRNFRVYGKVSWGARTLDGADQMASEWKYIPVRRLALFIEESLYRGTQWVVFEPNDEPLWAQIRLNIGAFMHNLFRQGAFQGSTPKDAYLVKCDKETTTQNDIDLGIVNILVGFAPLKPAEFVILKIQQLAGQIEV